MISGRDESGRDARGPSPLGEAIRRRARRGAVIVGVSVFVAMLAYRNPIAGESIPHDSMGGHRPASAFRSGNYSRCHGGRGACGSSDGGDFGDRVHAAQEEHRAGKASVGLATRKSRRTRERCFISRSEMTTKESEQREKHPLH